MSDEPQRYLVADYSQIDPRPCPCGTTRRAFTEDPDGTATAHYLQVSGAAKLHYHQRLTEIYFFLEGEGEMELDGERVPVGPRSCVMVKPGCRHRAVGAFTVFIVAMPAFDPTDEWFD